MQRRRVVQAVVACVTLAAAGPIGAHAEPRAVVELFTSQGCSSCPPADKILGELAHDPSVVAVSVPVDYWDYLGWKDTLASPKNTQRQRAYAKSRGDRDIYTPQVVVNGTIHVVGNDRAAIDRAIAQSDAKGLPMSLPVTLAVKGGKLKVEVGAEKSGAVTGEVWLCGLTAEVPVNIGRGENTGRSITYHNVARRWIKLGEFKGRAQSWNVALSEINGGDINTAAVFVQTGTPDKPGAMLGGAMMSLR